MFWSPYSRRAWLSSWDGLPSQTLFPQTEAERQRALAAAHAEADAIRRQATLEAKEAAQKIRGEVDAELRVRRQEIDRQAAATGAKHEALERRDRDIKAEHENLHRKERQLQAREQAAEASARAGAAQVAEARARMEKVAGMTEADARRALEAEVRESARAAAALEVRRIEDEAREQAQQKAQMILGAAVQRYASEYVAERTVSVVPLPSDDMKGRIIGREGRNIRALEQATGIDLIIDDTPEAVVISCFNPVRREIARLALTRLIADGRIHPTRIEEMVKKATEEVEQQCKEAGEQAAFDSRHRPSAPRAVAPGGQVEVSRGQRAEPACSFGRGGLPVGRDRGRARLSGEDRAACGPVARHRLLCGTGDRGLARPGRRGAGAQVR